MYKNKICDILFIHVLREVEWLIQQQRLYRSRYHIHRDRTYLYFTIRRDFHKTILRCG